MFNCCGGYNMDGLARFLPKASEIRIEGDMVYYVAQGHELNYCTSIHCARKTAYTILAAIDKWEREQSGKLVAFVKSPP